jgi:hypothetical protein
MATSVSDAIPLERIGRTFIIMDQARTRLAMETVAGLELEDPEADACLRRNFRDYRYLHRENPDGSRPRFQGADCIDRLVAVRETYHLTARNENIGHWDMVVWHALQAAAFVVQQDLVQVAQYAARLEAEVKELKQARREK